MPKKHPFHTYLIILLLASLLNALLSRFAVLAWEIAPGVSALYFAVAFMIPLALWFGAWGALAAYIGCLVGAGMTGMPLTVNLYWSLADLWQVLLPLLVFRAHNLDPELKTRKSLLFFLLYGWLLNNLAGAAWGSAMLAVGHVIAWSGVLKAFAGWLGGNLIVTILIALALLKFVTPWIHHTGYYIKGYLK